MKPITRIRSIGLGKINHLTRAARHFDELQPAFAAWAAGEVYVCKKTGDYRYRFGEQSKSVTPWNSVAREIFNGPEELAFAAMVLADRQPQPVKPAAPAQVPSTARPNIIALANASREEAA